MRILRWGEAPGLSRWVPPVITSVLPEGGRGGFDAEEGNVLTKARCYIAGFEDGGRGQELRNASQAALKAGKVQAVDSPLEPLEGAQPCRHVDFCP